MGTDLTFEFPTATQASRFFDAVEDLAIETGEEIAITLAQCVVDVAMWREASSIPTQRIFDIANSFEGEWSPESGEVESNPNDCPECARSFGPHFTGKCVH